MDGFLGYDECFSKSDVFTFGSGRIFFTQLIVQYYVTDRMPGKYQSNI